MSVCQSFYKECHDECDDDHDDDEYDDGCHDEYGDECYDEFICKSDTNLFLKVKIWNFELMVRLWQ